MQRQEVDRVLQAISLVNQVEERFSCPKGIAILHPIVLIKQAEQRLATVRCTICGTDDVTQEQHHVAGRLNFPDTITVCKSCHDEFTNILQPKWIPWKSTERNPIECYFLGWSDIFYLLWQRTDHLYFYELSKSFALNARYQREA